MEQSVEELRAASVGKPKFKFKRKGNKGKETISLTSTVKMEEKVSQTTDLEIPHKVTKEESTSSHISLSGHSNRFLSWAALPPPTSTATDIAISDLSHCVVNLLSHDSDSSESVASALHVRNVVNTVLLLPRINGSALLHDLRNCIIVLGCHQVRYIVG
jgi:tubulin-specific chaperone C